ncbi:MAG: hypothetical protein AAGA53_05975 [Pseudomonadota bacterium]
MKNLLKVAAVAAFVAVPLQAQAVTDNIPFTGTVSATCLITVTGGGTLAANAGFTSLSSVNAGGAAGTANVTSNGAFSVSLDPVTNFDPTTTAPNADLNTLFNSSYDLAGANTTTGATGTTALANTGITNVSVDLTATKSSGVFEAGSYDATVVLRCE